MLIKGGLSSNGFPKDRPETHFVDNPATQEGLLPLSLFPWVCCSSVSSLRSVATAERDRRREGRRCGSSSLGLEIQSFLDSLLPVSPQRNSSLPDENNVARLQEELKALKVREGEAVASARELKLQLQELSDTWQVRASCGVAPAGFAWSSWWTRRTSGLTGDQPWPLEPFHPAF